MMDRASSTGVASQTRLRVKESSPQLELTRLLLCRRTVAAHIKNSTVRQCEVPPALAPVAGAMRWVHGLVVLPCHHTSGACAQCTCAAGYSLGDCADSLPSGWQSTDVNQDACAAP
jgi:hypothetical protein